VGHPQTLGQQEFELFPEPLAPMAQVRALVRKFVLEELRPGEVLEVRVIDPAVANAFIRQAVNVLEQQEADDEPSLDSWPALLGIQRGNLAIEKVPVDLARELHQLVLHVDILIQPRAEQITQSRRLVLLRPHDSLRCGDGITAADSRESLKRNCKLPRLQTSKACNLKSAERPKRESPSMP
jgi:hypothetical protein